MTRPKPWKPLLALLLGLGVITVLAGGDLRARVDAGLAWVESQGVWAPVVFILIYALAAVLLVPASLMTLGAGSLFGVVQGSVIASIASTLAAALAFLIARYGAREWVAARFVRHPALGALDAGVAERGWLIVVLTRLSPAFPFGLLNYALGLTRVGFVPYIVASWVTMLPATVLVVYLGTLTREIGHQKSPGEWAVYSGGLMATLAVTVIVTRLAKKALTPPTPL
jgi:uncharacterized membrane protein YdjX (TVP38/TMEM64 family)